VFNEYKRETPPKPLPLEMRDHSLSGRLAGIRECHLDDDVLLLYTHKDNVVSLLLVCAHDDLCGPREKALSKRINRLQAQMPPQP